MKKDRVRIFVKVLQVLVVLAIIGCVLATMFSPVLAAMRWTELSAYELLESFAQEPPAPEDDWIYFSPTFVLVLLWIGAWEEPYTIVLTLFLMTVGVCAAVILWQGWKVLGTVQRGMPFHTDNAQVLNRAAICCFVISAAALIRTVSNVIFGKSPLNYTTLFIFLFLLGGLLLRLLSALLRQAAELKAENDLTI